jgi:hypothetical protein
MAVEITTTIKFHWLAKLHSIYICLSIAQFISLSFLTLTFLPPFHCSWAPSYSHPKDNSIQRREKEQMYLPEPAR